MKTKQLPIEVVEWLKSIGMKLSGAFAAGFLGTLLVMVWWWAIFVSYFNMSMIPVQTAVGFLATVIILVGLFLGLKELKK